MRRLSRADRVWQKKQARQEKYRRGIRRRLNRAERLLQEVYDLESAIVGRGDLQFALTSRAREALASARYNLMSVRNR